MFNNVQSAIVALGLRFIEILWNRLLVSHHRMSHEASAATASYREALNGHNDRRLMLGVTSSPSVAAANSQHDVFDTQI